MVALLLGTATMGTLVVVSTRFRPPGLEGPVEIGRVAVVTVLGVIAFPLSWRATSSDTRSRPSLATRRRSALDSTSPAHPGRPGWRRQPPSFALLGVLLVISPVVAWRDRSNRGRPTGS